MLIPGTLTRAGPMDTLFDAPQYPADNLAPNRSTWNDFGLNRECGSGGADAKLALGRRRWSEGCVKLMISVPSLPGRAGSPRSTALRNRPSLLPNAAWMRERLSPVASVRSVMVVPSKLFSQKSRIAELIAWSSSKLRGRPFVTCSIYQINPLSRFDAIGYGQIAKTAQSPQFSTNFAIRNHC